MKKENWMEYMEALIDQRLAEGVGGWQTFEVWISFKNYSF